LFPERQLEPSRAEDSSLHGRLIFVLDTWRTVEPGDRDCGLTDLVEEQELLWHARRLADTLLAPLAGTDDFLVEYSPSHIGAVAVIDLIYPDALLLHVVRDGGDVTARLASPARNMYWPRLAPQRMHAGWLAREAARQWCDEQRTADEFADEPNYFVARIERIMADPNAFIEWFAARFGIEVDDQALEDAAAALGSGTWSLRKSRPGRPQALLNAIGADLLEHYEYQPADVSDVVAGAARLELGYDNFTERSRQARLKLADRLRELSVRWDAEARE
jgi:hypothetical protein